MEKELKRSIEATQENNPLESESTITPTKEIKSKASASAEKTSEKKIDEIDKSISPTNTYAVYSKNDWWVQEYGDTDEKKEAAEKRRRKRAGYEDPIGKISKTISPTLRYSVRTPEELEEDVDPYDSDLEPFAETLKNPDVNPYAKSLNSGKYVWYHPGFKRYVTISEMYQEYESYERFKKLLPKLEDMDKFLSDDDK